MAQSKKNKLSAAKSSKVKAVLPTAWSVTVQSHANGRLKSIKLSEVKKFFIFWSAFWRVGGALILVVASLAYYRLAFTGRIYPGVKVGGLSLAGYSVPEAEASLRQTWNRFTENGIPLIVAGRRVVLTNLVTSTSDPDLTYELMTFNPAAAAKAAYRIGRSGYWLQQLVEPVKISIVGASASQLAVEVEIDRVLQYIRDSLPGLERQPVPAKLTVDLADNVGIEPEVQGLVIDASALKRALENRLANLSAEPIIVSLVPVKPELNEALVARLLPQARQLLTNSAIKFVYKENFWTAESSVWHRWLGARFNNISREAELAFLPDATENFWQSIEKTVNQPARDAKFEIRAGRVVAFQGSWQGRQVDRVASLEKSFAALLANSAAPPATELVVTTIEPNVTTAETNDVGISEIIGIGRSNFKGSPPNRRHNIKVGAAALNGLLIKDGEEFSLLKALLPVEAATGYLPELVIKGNRTIPEYGGGLCQIGTTIFRATLDAGLPVTARRNHSYRVVYYEPAGTDATIYDPAPDYKFINDTGNAILIQTKIEGDELIFEFWGKSDGRKVNQTKPRIFNITPPPPTKIIETEDLEPGEKKCTEKPHSGADTEFTYSVTYPNGETKQEVFKSHYIPWQEVCLVGVPKGTLAPEGEASVPAVLPSTDTAGQSGSVTQ